MSWLARLFWGILAVALFLLAALAVNQAPIALEFLTWRTPEVSVFWWLLAAFAAGLLMGLLGITVMTTLNLRNRRLAKRLDNAEQELRKVRSLAIHE